MRSWAEVGADDLAPFVDERTLSEHVLAADVLDVLDSQGRVTSASVSSTAWPWAGRSPTATPAATSADDARPASSSTAAPSRRVRSQP